MTSTASSHSEQPAPRMAPRRGISAKATKAVAAVAAVVALMFGAHAVTGGGSSTATTGAQGSPPSGATGAAPRMMGTQVSGATLAKLKSVVAAKYPGTVERAMQRPDGSYEVHIINSGGSEVHVLVSEAFRITGTETGPPGGGAPQSNAASQSKA